VIRHTGSFLLQALILASGMLTGMHQGVKEQDTPPTTGSLIVNVSPPAGHGMTGIPVRYTQTSHDFWLGYGGPIPAAGLPEVPFGFNLELQCIPWVGMEPQPGIYPLETEEIASIPISSTQSILGNDCLLYFGGDTLNDLPPDLGELEFDDLYMRAGAYLEHAVRHQINTGINLFIIKEPAYPTANILGFTTGQWYKLVKLACQTIRAEAPRAVILIEIIPQYLPGLRYTPYTFLDTLIRDGVSFDGILMVFSPPVAARFDPQGYPAVDWISSQMDVFSDLGKKMLVRFSGITAIEDEKSRLAWVSEVYAALFVKPTVAGIYWDESERFPVKLTAASWAPLSTLQAPTSAITTPMLDFVRAHTTIGTTETDANGMVAIHAFAGEYAIEVDGIPGVTQAHIYRGEERYLDIEFGEGESTLAAGLRGNPPLMDEESHSWIGLPMQTVIILGIAAIFLTGLGYFVWKKRKRAHETGQN
jgi:hypothetical protein